MYFIIIRIISVQIYFYSNAKKYKEDKKIWKKF